MTKQVEVGVIWDDIDDMFPAKVEGRVLHDVGEDEEGDVGVPYP